MFNEGRGRSHQESSLHYKLWSWKGSEPFPAATPENPGPVCHQVQALRVCDLKQGCLQLQPMQGLQVGEGI